MHNYPSQVLQVHIKTIISHKLCNFFAKEVFENGEKV